MKKNLKKVLLVEDDSAIVDIYQTMLKKNHFTVDAISSGQEAIKKIKRVVAGEETKPDIVLLDLILPDINGVEVLYEIRKNDATKDIKVFVLTNQQESEMPHSDVKPDKFIVKANTTPTQLLDIIKEYIK